MEVITVQVKEEKVASTVLVIYVIVIIQTNKQTKIGKQAEINHYILGHIFFMGTKNLGNL